MDSHRTPSKHYRLPRAFLAILAGITLMISSLFCNFPPLNPTKSGVEPTFSAIMTEAVRQPTSTTTPLAYEITLPTPQTPTAGVTISPAIPTQPGGTPFAPGGLPTSVFSNGSVLGKIVFACYIDGFDQICLMNADGSGSVRLTNTSATDFYPSLSPDGQTIVFSSRRDGPFQIYNMKIDGSDVVRLTQGLGNLYAPEISPDEKTIIFTVETGHTQNIWAMNRDGSNPHPLTESKLDNIDPTWSPDGSQIAFSSSSAGDAQLWVMNSDGSNQRQVTNLPDMGGRNSWSPDGSRLAFYAGPRGNHNVYTIRVDGQDLQQLTQGGDNLAPCYSLDGQWIAFTSYRDFNNEIYIMHPDGTSQTNVSHNSRPDWQPRWGK